MKHEVKITTLLLGMFLMTQLIGLVVIDSYAPKVQQQLVNGTITNVTVENQVPYGMEPPKVEPKIGLLNIIVALIIAIAVFFMLTRIRASVLIRVWFAFVSLITVSISLNGLFLQFFDAKLLLEILALAIAIPLTFYKIFRRNIIVHNFTELLIYPGLAALFVPILNVWTMLVLLLIISLYDMYAVWRSKFMVNLAKYQIKDLKVFTGFFVPYITKEQWKIISKSKGEGKKKMKVSLAILGGGDVAFPLIFAGIILRSAGLIPALAIVLCSTLALLGLFIYSRKGKFYPAMPFIALGCLVGWLITLLL